MEAKKTLPSGRGIVKDPTKPVILKNPGGKKPTKKQKNDFRLFHHKSQRSRRPHVGLGVVYSALEKCFQDLGDPKSRFNSWRNMEVLENKIYKDCFRNLEKNSYEKSWKPLLIMEEKNGPNPIRSLKGCFIDKNYVLHFRTTTSNRVDGEEATEKGWYISKLTCLGTDIKFWYKLKKILAKKYKWGEAGVN